MEPLYSNKALKQTIRTVWVAVGLYLLAPALRSLYRGTSTKTLSSLKQHQWTAFQTAGSTMLLLAMVAKFSPRFATPSPQQKYITATLTPTLNETHWVGLHKNKTLTNPFGEELTLPPNDWYISTKVTNLKNPDNLSSKSGYTLPNNFLLVIPKSFLESKQNKDTLQITYGGIPVHFHLNYACPLNVLPPPKQVYFKEDSDVELKFEPTPEDIFKKQEASLPNLIPGFQSLHSTLHK